MFRNPRSADGRTSSRGDASMQRGRGAAASAAARLNRAELGRRCSMGGRSLQWSRRVHAGVFALGVVMAAAPGWAADTPKEVTFSNDVAPIFQAKCQDCHQPNSIAPMSLITFQEARPVGAVDSSSVWHPADAAVAHRQVRRRPEIQERHVAQRRADRHHRELGRSGRAAGQPERHAAAQAAATDNQWQAVSATASAHPTSSSTPPNTRCRPCIRTPGGGRPAISP